MYLSNNKYCPIVKSKLKTVDNILETALNKIQNNELKKMNMIWLEATGCSGNIISLLNASNPNALYFLKNMVNLKYNNSIMADQGQQAFDQFLKTLNSDFILAVDGAVSTKDNGKYNIIASYNDKPITALQAVKMAGEKAKYILSVGTCASFGGISAARPNPAQCKSVKEVLDKNVINLPGCPSNPRWIIGTVAHLLMYGIPKLDNQNRPILFYGITIHDICPRRLFFEKKIFAEKLGDKGCLFKLGCRGPVTQTDCPIGKWNNKTNWPIEDNTPCIGCANAYFPDGMEPFVRY
ncbi:hydrogenase small subunit [Haloimpatiens sp. FM7330]|uniref:hydrogenase small subunit n=1 Tax=Haloimpatiens sp. FM7330 TaxID=3298610 RepID=UPI00363F4F89